MPLSEAARAGPRGDAATGSQENTKLGGSWSPDTAKPDAEQDAKRLPEITIAPFLPMRKMAQPVSDARLRRLCARLHALGPRPLYELFREVLDGADPLARLERYAEIDAAIVKYLGADQMREECAL